MSTIEKSLKRIAYFQHRFPLIMLGIILLITTLALTQVPNLEVQSDFDKENPRHLPAYVLTDRIKDEFGGENAVILIMEVEENDENELIDLRDPELITFLNNLENSLKKDSRVIKTSSIGTIFQANSYVPNSRSEFENFIRQYSELSGFFSNDFRITFLTITTNIGGAYEDVVPFEKMLNDKIDAVGKPGGVKLTITGGPSFGRVIRETVFSDTTYTITLASIGIFLLLLLTERSFVKSILIFIPLIFSLIWTGGILGAWGLKLSIASVALGSIILGLGVEYGVFMLTRYNEERYKNKKSQLDSNQEAVSKIGSALLGSGTTTIAGFLALTFSITPMMQNLGISLATGIFCSLLSAILVAPLLIIIEENYEKYILEKTIDDKIKKRDFFREVQ